MGIKSRSDKIIDVIIYILMFLIVFICIYPLWYILVASLSSYESVVSGRVIFWVKNFTLEAYKVVTSQKNLWISYGNTVFYAVFGTLVNMTLTVLCAYALSKKWLPGRKLITFFIMVSMWFSPGMMASYINYRDLGLLDSRWGMLLVGAIGTYYVILMRAAFESVPASLEEAAHIDGATEFQILTKIYLPLSTATIMTLSLYYFVGHWNSYFWSMILLSSDSKIPLQVILKKLVVQMSGLNSERANMDYTVISRETVVYATMIIAVIPMMFIYPFVQKFFVKGIMLGAVKE